MTDATPRQGHWGQERRLEFIDYRLLWEGRLNRADLTEFFKISIPQASLDFSAYKERAPDNMVYDRAQKTYVATEQFVPIFAKADGTQYLNELLWRHSGALARSESFAGWSPLIDTSPLPTRKIETNILVPLLRAMQAKQVITIGYQSMSNPEPATRKIFPIAFAQDGYRWHVRAYCLQSEKHKDFVLGRIYAAGPAENITKDIPEDVEWNTPVNVVLGPNPNFLPAKRSAIERDYNMVNGEVTIKTRLAQLFYLRRRLNVLKDSPPPDEHQHVVLLRIEAFDGRYLLEGKPAGA